MDSTPSPSSSLPSDQVTRALGNYDGREARTASAGPAAVRDSGGSGTAAAEDSPGGQEQILGSVDLDRGLRITRVRMDAPAFEGLTIAPGKPFAELLPPGDVPTVTRRLRQVIETREAHVARVQRLRRDDGTELVVSMSILPAAASQEGLTVSLIAMAKRLHLYAAENAIGTSLDIGETARSLAQSLLAWGDVAAVDLDFGVWTGEAVTEHPQGRIRLRRAALVPDMAWPDGYLTPGDNLPREASRLLAFAVRRDEVGQPIVIPDRGAIERALRDPRLVRALIPGDRPASLACIPLVLESLDGKAPIVLGVAEIWRRPDRPFLDSELLDLQELAARTAHHIDLARQHQREHAQVLALQRRLLPRAGSDAIEVASVYQPTTPDSAGVGGDWVNSFPLPDGRTALVVGDVVGHGLGAAAAMGQLSMEARALLSAGLAPDEVLEHLAETVTLLDDADAGLVAGYSALGSTCCIAVYDPVSHQVVMSSAGHLPPVLVLPDGSATVLAVRPHPGLGTEFAVREPFDTHTFAAPPGSLLALYTDGLVEDPAVPIDEGIDRLADAVGGIHPWDDLQRAARRLVTDLAPRNRPRDDMTLLLARMSGCRKRDTAVWELPARADAASRARALAATRLRQWEAREETRDSALLLISELVTNAVRFATGPITVRLIKAGRSLLCEIGDKGNGRPRLRRRGLLDDSGRGLYVVHNLTSHWGVRWTDTGKVVWAELSW
ncbi:Histidine kinase-like ATPase domain-containing protein [Actinacidiphila yanglinensis]|uniref:protein-serine/threonine phosphatase n=1 Tax=Actinacidiphila yanglinensis TaxID=310779 RepID=A0A1H6E127_9ACTN|nr:ATP-binding SpoIIE family protein phosphatase [Actinacidiphila yanglinensis]SEG90873.1 Histidine kinase-like ATPase domain-containing protein [Actinacidiphila yanglinensis]